MGFPFPKMSVAKDGHSQAHMDVLVAFFGKGSPTADSHIAAGYKATHQSTKGWKEGLQSANIRTNPNNLHGIGTTLGIHIITLGNHHQITILDCPAIHQLRHRQRIGPLVRNLG